MAMKKAVRISAVPLVVVGVPFALACGGGSPSGGEVDASVYGADAAGASGSGGMSSGSGGGSGSSGGAASSSGSGGAASSSGGGSGSGSGGASSSGSGAGSGGSSSGTGGSTSGGTSSSGAGSSGSSSGAGGSSSGGINTDAGSGGTGTDGSVDTSKKITVWLAGDSTMQPCQNPCPCGWGSQFQPLFNSNATVVDNGVGGRSIQTWLYEANVMTTMTTSGECVVSPMTYATRWQSMLDPTTGMKAGDYLFIEFGINDTDTTCPRHVGSALFQSLLGVMAQAAKDRGVQPIFLTSTNAIVCTGSTCPPNRAFGPETKAAGMADNVPVIDLTQLTADFYTSLGLCPNDGNYMSTTTLLGTFFCDDHTHFEAYGATQIAGVVAKALRDQGIGLAAYLK